MKTIYRLFIAAAALSAVLSCSKLDSFLDKAPESNQSYVSTISDCDLLMNNGDLIHGALNVVFQDDGIEFGSMTDLYYETSEEYRTYTYWTDPKYIYEPSADDNGWSMLYKNIYTCNVVLNYIDNVSGDDETLRSQLKGEALLGRAFYHFSLVNMYARQYNAATAAEDAGVPYVTDIDASAVRSRASVQEVYDNMTADLEEALKYLRDATAESGKNYRGNLAAANSLLARIYLHEGNWAEAQKYAEASLALDSFLYDYNDYDRYSEDETDPSVRFYENGEAYGSFTDREITYLREPFDGFGGISYYMSVDYSAFFGGLKLTDDAVSLFRAGDRRFDLFFGMDIFTGNTTIQHLKHYDTGFYGQGNVGTSVPETYLILAEAQARQGDTAGACTTLDKFRTKRYDKTSYSKFESSDKAAVLKEILDDKTVEFIYQGMRWFEMRRLYALGEYNRTIVRKDSEGNEIGRLVPSADRMVLPIGEKVTDINPNITQNPYE